MLNRPIHYTQPVTLLLPTGVGVKTFFDEQPRLERAYVLGIEAYSDDQLTLDQESRPIIGAADVVIPMVTFKVGSEERVFEVPYSKLVAELQAGAVNQYAALEINWSKSYVEVPNGSVFAVALPVVLFFNVHYIPYEMLNQFTQAELRSFLF